MVKFNFSFLICIIGAVLLFSFCSKKKNTNTTTTVTPINNSTTTNTTNTTYTTFPTYTTILTYTESSVGTGGNPNIGNQTATGTTTLTNPATQNSNLLVGGAGWSNPSCISTNSLVLKAINGNTDVTLNFLFPPASGTQTYVIAASPAVNAVTMIINNAPNQPSGVVWYGKTGQVTVTTTSVSIDASFSGILCAQQNFNFPTVGVSGNIGCN